jgi:hypothetical protein
MQDSAGPIRAVEGVNRDCEPGVRMHRIEDPSGPRARARSQTLRQEGLTVSTKNSSDLGFGKKAFPSVGVAEALAGASYGGTRPAKAEDYSSTRSGASAAADPPLHVIKSGVFGRGVWDVSAGQAAGWEELQQRAGTLARHRAPNRVFDTESPAVIAKAVGDPFVREQRELRELEATKPPRPQQRPASFTASAKVLQSMRDTAAKRAEVANVQSLEF